VGTGPDRPPTRGSAGMVPTPHLLAWRVDANRLTVGDDQALTSPPTAANRMTSGMVALFAVACAISAANLYYAQPLLPLISRDLDVGSGSAALVITAAQVGYGVGLALIVPLGDTMIRRR